MTDSNLFFPLVAGSANGKVVHKKHRSYCFPSYKKFQPADTLFLEQRHLSLLNHLCQLTQTLEIIIMSQYFLLALLEKKLFKGNYFHSLTEILCNNQHHRQTQ